MTDSPSTSLFGDDEGEQWSLAGRREAVLQFRIKNLDTGESFHVANVTKFVEPERLTTFADSDEEDVAPVAAGPRYVVRIVNATRRRAPDGKEFASYTIQVKDNERGVEWNVYRRFTDFFEFDRLVRMSPYKFMVAGVEMPKKVWFGSLDDSVIRERQAALQAYLDYALRQLSGQPCLYINNFLELDFPRVAGGKIARAGLELRRADQVPGMMSMAQATSQFPSLRR